jgi:hypothetical protein
VWEKSTNYSVDFFPVGDCFHAQEERTMAAQRAAAEARAHQGGAGMHKKKVQQKPSLLKKAQTTYI